MNRHISEQYDTELENVRRRLMEMGGLVERQLADASQALVNHDAELAAYVIDGDERVNQLQVDLDDSCVHIIARRQPTASDLRLLIGIMRASTDLERAGDEAQRIAKMALAVADLKYPEDQYAEIKQLSDLVIHMVSRALDSFARLDVEGAKATINSDKQVDDAYGSICKTLSDRMSEHPDQVKHAINTLWTARALERIGDHAKNISEYVIFQVEGEDIRHAHHEG